MVANEVNKAAKLRKLKEEQKAKETTGSAGECVVYVCIVYVVVLFIIVTVYMYS